MPFVRDSRSLALATGPDYSLSEADMLYFCEMIEVRAGISLKSSKYDLVQSRLRSRLNALSLSSYRDYRSYLEGLSYDDPEWTYFTNLLTTNKTDFFREPAHFDFLVREILPAWIKTNQRTFRVWSAACSTGEEAYTLSLVLSRFLPEGRDFKVLATDIDTDVLATAKNSVYSDLKRPEIPSEYHLGGLDVGQREASGWFRIKPHLKSKVFFRRHNLLETSTPEDEPFDLILCRNVLIYFAPETIDFVQNKLFGAVRSGGHLFIGHSESLQGHAHKWSPVGPSIYKKSVR